LIGIAEGLFTALSPEKNPPFLNGASSISSSLSLPQSSSSLRATANTLLSSTTTPASGVPGDEGNDDGQDVRERGGKGNVLMRRVRVDEVNLRWDVNVHPWFPIPVVDRHLPDTELQ
jgi:hypothetical protein